MFNKRKRTFVVLLANLQQNDRNAAHELTETKIIYSWPLAHQALKLAVQYVDTESRWYLAGALSAGKKSALHSHVADSEKKPDR